MRDEPTAAADLVEVSTALPGPSLAPAWPFTPPVPERLDPTVPLRRSGQALGDPRATVGDFWAWAFSDLRQNSVRGHLAEYIVAWALDVRLKVRSGWDDHDLELDGMLVPRSSGGRTPARLQVKSSGYLQGWPQQQLSLISFGGLRRRPFPWSAEHGGFKLGTAKAAKADVFVFAIQMAKTHEAYNPLAVDQWEFRVLPAHQVVQDSLGYSTLCRRTKPVTFEGLAAAVRGAARERIQKLAGALAQLTKARQRADQAAIERWQRVVAELEA